MTLKPTYYGLQQKNAYNNQYSLTSRSMIEYATDNQDYRWIFRFLITLWHGFRGATRLFLDRHLNERLVQTLLLRRQINFESR